MPAVKADLRSLFGPIANLRHVALAVSGGSDSMALLRLAHEWAGEFGKGCTLSVLTVDHRLRQDSAEEAVRVGRWARGLGLDHAILPWNESRGGASLQARARKARYDLMAAWCCGHGAETILTAHTRDDQAETVLMRLARTASIDSLAAIRREGQWDGVRLVRPLLAMGRETLRTYLSAIGQEWIEDPSNSDERFERVRLRQSLAGLGLPAEALADLARAAAEVSDGLWKSAEDYIDLYVKSNSFGFGEVQAGPLLALPPAVRDRVLAGLVGRYGGGGRAEPSEISRLASALASGLCRRTLAGAMILRRKDVIVVGREAGRIARTPVAIPASGLLLWDRRFAIEGAPGAEVVAAGCLPDVPRNGAIPAFVQAGLPAVMAAGGLLAIPHLGIGSGARAAFRPAHYR